MSRNQKPTAIDTALTALTRIADALPPGGLDRLVELVPEKDSYSIDDFCARNSISRAMYYLLKAEGDAPKEMRFGTKVLISKEAAAEWRMKPRLRGAHAPQSSERKNSKI